jgi:hypothetical protein
MGIAKRWKPNRAECEREDARSFPEWGRHLAIGGYREQGWVAFDQNKRGAVVATGAWGDEIFLMSDGSIACTKYPDGYPHREPAALTEQPRTSERGK